MEQRICDYVKSRPEPDFFHQPDDQALLQIHEDIKHSIEKATDTMTVDLDEDLMLRQITAEVMGTEDFDEQAFRKSVDYIEIAPDDAFIYHFKNGRTAAWQKA